MLDDPESWQEFKAAISSLYLQYEYAQAPMSLPASLPSPPMPAASLPSLLPAAPVMHSSPQLPAPALMLSLAVLEALLSPAPPVTPAIPARSLLSASDAQSLQPAPLNWPLLAELLPDGVALSLTPSSVSVLPTLITAAPLPPLMLSFSPMPTALVCQAPHTPAAPPSLPTESVLLQTPILPAVSLAASLPHTPPATIATLVPSQPHPLAPSIPTAAHVPMICLPPVPDNVPPVSDSSLALLAKAHPLPCPPPVTVIAPTLKLLSPAAQQMLPAVPVIPPLPPPAQVLILPPPPLPDGLLATPDEEAFCPIRKGPILAVTDVVTTLPMSSPQLQLPSLLLQLVRTPALCIPDTSDRHVYFP
ncbi:hypothetical protein AX14_007493 [Amanita brunnescens Koide BX004]|nr:hypothetical protein AX14_007493 [Amanita brunnescens Koide BX004]